MAARKNTSSTTNSSSLNAIPGEDKARLVAEAAYFRALNRGFENGSPENDWLAAEQEVDAMLAQIRQATPSVKKKAS